MWKFTQGTSIFAGMLLVITFIASESAPQQAAGAAISIGLAVIPYCLARATAEVRKEKENQPENAFFE
ncbi:hypothetical protein [Gracilimonas sp.]|uniref:hypothetical protein n=1 Tax=Gracilimonas sp. TaxID=1974203 RepID=UPI003BAD8FD8